MANYIKLKQTVDKLPLLDKEWLFVNPLNIINTSFYKNNILESLSFVDKNKIYIPCYTKNTGSYPRFDITDSVYKLKRNELNILPTKESKFSFNEITDDRGIELLSKSRAYQKVYLFYSGGLDSTTILTSILKSWDKSDLEKLSIVMNNNSIVEYPLFYQQYIENKLDIIDSEIFFSESVFLEENILYVTGDCGGPLLSYDDIVLYDTNYPNTYLQSWIHNKDNIISFFNSVATFDEVQKSIPEHLTSVYDFLWWSTFNYGYDIDIYYLILLYGRLREQTETRKFILDNQFLWYNNLSYQNWAMYSPTNFKIGKVSEVKLPMRKYILDFTGDLDYYNQKQVNFSVSKNKHLLKRVPMGIDVDYNIYYREAKKL